MRISGYNKETYLYINGLEVDEEIKLNENKTILPVKIPPSLDIISQLVKNDLDFGIAVIFSGQVFSQIKITSTDPKNLAVTAWNSQWDLVLISAIFNCQVECNLQCTQSAENINCDSIFEITNYHLYGLVEEPYKLTREDSVWLSKYYDNAQNLMENDAFITAIHSLANYRWNSMPRIQLAILWAGIESLFGIESELSYRVSLYISKFLSNDDNLRAKELYNEVRALYKARSSAVHGSKIKGEQIQIVEQSASILNKLIIKCITTNSMPDIENLLF